MGSHGDDEDGGCCPFWRTIKSRVTPSKASKNRRNSGVSENEKIPGTVGKPVDGPSSIENAIPEIVVSPEDVGDDPTIDDTPGYTSSDIKSLSPARIRAERRFKSAADKLKEAFPEGHNDLQLPGALSLQGLDVEDVNATGKTLETAVEDLLCSREKRTANRERQHVVTTCITRWYTAYFPYIKPAVKVVGVNGIFVL
jgi:hypothetical protein